MSEVEGRNNRILQLEKQLSAKQDQINQKGNDVEAANNRLNDMEQELQSERDRIQQLQQDMSNIQNRLKGTERDLSQEKNRLQQLQADIANADSNAAALSKKMMEKSTQLESSNRRCNELEQEVSRLEDQIGGLQGQLRSAQVMKEEIVFFKKHIDHFSLFKGSKISRRYGASTSYGRTRFLQGAYRSTRETIFYKTGYYNHVTVKYPNL